MLLKPDLGLHIRKLGRARDPFIWLDLIVDHLGFVDRKTVTFCTFLPFGDRTYAASFDMPKTVFLSNADIFFERAPRGLKAAAVDRIQQTKRFPARFDFSHRFLVDVEARLGKPTHGQHDTFIPFVVKSFLSVRLRSM